MIYLQPFDMHVINVVTINADTQIERRMEKVRISAGIQKGDEDGEQTQE